MNKLIQAFNKDTALIPAVAILLGLLVGAFIMLVGGYNPLLAYSSLFSRVFGSLYNFGETIRQITPLIFTGLSVAFAFRTGLFNIGAEGQYLMAATGATFVGVLFDLPWFLHAPLAILVGALLGGIWGAIAGYLKAVRGVNEVITTIMLNWIALYLSNYLIRFLIEPGQQRTPLIKPSASITMDTLSLLFDNARLHLGTLLALLAVVLFYILLWRTRQGFELRAVGLNPHAAEYAGINVNRNLVRSMFISGAFAGLAGVSEILGVFGYQAIIAGFPGYGFDGIAVALLGGNTPVGVLLGAVLFGSLSYGSAGMKFGAGVPPEIVRVVIASVIFFVASHGIIRWLFRPLKAKQKEVR